MTKRKKFFERVTIENFAAEARCVARVEGKVIFVEKTAPGDVVDLKITRNRKTYFEATPIKFHQFSEKRIEPFCAHFGECGGCKWQHVAYDEQLRFKRQQVIDQFERLGGFQFPEVLPTMGSLNTQFYRNKLEFTFSDRRWLTREEIQKSDELDRNGLGFHKPGQFDKVLDIKECYLQPEPSNSIRMGLREFALQHHIPFFNLIEHKGLLRNLIVRTSNTGGVMIILQVAEDDKKNIIKLMEFLQNFSPAITSLNYVVNSKGNEMFYDLDVINYAGDPYMFEEMGGLRFRIGPKSFFQTNSQQAHQLYQTTSDFAGLEKSDIVYDLYSGTGTIANFIAGKVKKVVGIESVEDAVKDARINAEINKISNTLFVIGDMKDMLTEEFTLEHGKPDVVIADPPRAGMHPNVVNSILQLRPDKLVYVSCNPATQARDIKILANKYEVKKVQPIDMFPHTHHIENVALLERMKNE